MKTDQFLALVLEASNAAQRSQQWVADHIAGVQLRTLRRWAGLHEGERGQQPPDDAAQRLQAYIDGHKRLMQSLPSLSKPQIQTQIQKDEE